MSYLVFARKFRPQNFEDIVGQEPITTTLQNAIREKRIAQSFLFSGTRGVGKTSAARILAKALNCEKGMVPEPCNQCFSCQEVTQGNSLDVLEIDGASNRGIENIRELRENVKFKPARGRFKIYIIDEVHMVTQDAFNALLKTLEEPPEHVKFIFATTELHKVPLTILSRCQKFVFRKVATARIVKKLEEILKVEKITHDEKSLYVIAKAADGSLRDAESLLDQVASFANGKITYSKVVESFGVPADEIYLALLGAILNKDTKKVLEIFSPLENEGKDMTQFVKGLMEMFRGLLILRVTNGSMPELVDVSPEVFAELSMKKDKFSKEDLLSIVTQLQALFLQVRRSLIPALHVETALIKLAVREDLMSVAELVKKLEEPGNSPAAPRPQNAAAPEARSAPAVQPARPVPAQRPVQESSSLKKTSETASIETPFTPPVSFSPASDKTVSVNDVERIWSEVLETVKTRKMSCGMFLSEAAPVDVDADLIVLGLPVEFKFHKESLEKPDNKKLVEEICQSLLGVKVRVNFVITTPDKMSVTVIEAKTEKEKVPDIVESALKLFNGKIVQKN